MPRKFALPAYLLFLLPLALLISLTPQPASAQEVTARIQGTVTDQSGAVVPGVSITATNVSTGVSYTVESTSDGSYQFLTLLIGTYTVSAQKSGFKDFRATGITLTVGQIYSLNIEMQVGAVAQEVTVQAAPVQVQTTTMQRGTVITENQLARIPTINRNWVQLQQLQPGVVSSSDRFGSNFATNGSQSQQNSYLVNGVDVNDIPLNTPLVLPSPDAIQEFAMVTSTIDPQYSRNSGAVLNAVIKSGTNRFHGSAFEYFRDTSLNARDFFLPSPQVFHRNLFGGTIGGPVLKNKLFFFFSYQGYRASQPQAGGNVPVFSANQRDGIFGAGNFDPAINTNATGAGSPIPLFGDATSICPVAGGTPCPAGTSYTDLWPTGQIPKEDLNTISLNLMDKYVPLPNSGTDYSFNPTRSRRQDQELFRIDYTITPHDSVWWYSFFQSTPTTDTLPFTGSNLPGFAADSQSHIQQHVGSWTHIFGSTMVNNLRAGTTRLNFVAVNPVTPVQPSSEGFQITPQNSAAAGIPYVGVTGYFNLGFSYNGPQPRIDQNYQITDDFSKVYGNHTFKLGWAGRRFNVWNPFYYINNGYFGFGGSGTYSTGNAAADFLLGFPDNYYQSSGGFIDAQAYENYMYFQDQWKVRPNFTLTYGLGYQIDTPMSNRANGAVSVNCFRPGQQSTVYPTSPAGLVFPGDKGCTSSGYSTHYNEVGPRLGFAWAPHWGAISGKGFSVRGGFGMYYDRSEEELALQNLLAPPFALFNYGIGNIGGVASFKAPYTDITCIDQTGNLIPNCSNFTGSAASAPNPYPFAPPAPGATNVDFNQYFPMSINVLDPNFRVPVSMNYNLTVERELPGQVILDVAYVGAQARHNISVLELNPGLNPQGCTTQTVTLGSNTYSCIQLRSVQNLYFPQNFKYDTSIFSSVGQQSTISNSNYNSLQISANKALSHGLTFLAAYTYSHSLDLSSSYENSSGSRVTNPFSNAYNYGDSAFDARHRFVFSYTYNIPSWNRGFMSFMPRRVTDGWTIAGITTFQMGFPVPISDSNYTSLTCDAYVYYGCWDNPNVSGPVTTLDPRNSSYAFGSNPTNDHYGFDPNLFSFADYGTFGNTGRNFFHGPGLNNWDIELTKDTRIAESYHLQLRVELYNAFNHAQFANPNGNVNSSDFGRITGTQHGPRLVQLAARFVF
jgi:hypothetical protein